MVLDWIRDKVLLSGYNIGEILRIKVFIGEGEGVLVQEWGVNDVNEQKSQHVVCFEIASSTLTFRQLEDKSKGLFSGVRKCVSSWLYVQNNATTVFHC